MKDQPLLLIEELHVLLLDRQRGGLIHIDDRSMRVAFSGAVLMDLAKAGRIDADLETLTVTDPTPLGDNILDPLLSVISSSREKADTACWIERFAAPEIANQVHRGVAQRLVNRGIFYRDPGGLLSLESQVVRTRRYPGANLPRNQDVVLRVMNVIFSEDIPTSEETMLIALADACGLFERLITKPELAERRGRIDLVRGLDLIGVMICEAISNTEEPEKGEPVSKAFLDETLGIRHQHAPMAPGALPLLWHTIPVRLGPTPRLARYYQSAGPVFRLRDLQAGEFTVLAGPEANLFCQRHGRALFRSHSAWAPLSKGMDAQRFILGLDGADHFSLRRAMAPGFSRDRYLAKLPEIRDIILESFPANGRVTAIKAFLELSSRAVGLACTDYMLSKAEAAFMDFFMRRLVATKIVRDLPKFMMRTPRARKAKAQFLGTFVNMVNARKDKESGNGQGQRDFVDIVQELHQSDPQLMPEAELRASYLGPIFAGMHTTGSAGTAAMYLVLKHPDVLQRIRTEADELYSSGEPNPEKMKDMDVTARAMMEALRMYNPFTPLSRDVINTFDFGGYTVPAGTNLLLAPCVPHYCEEFYPEPDQFDIDRYLPERAEHEKPGVYMPFGYGTHRCLGSGIAELHIIFALATIVRHFDVEMDPPNHKIRINYLSGVPAPTQRFKMKISPRRN